MDSIWTQLARNLPAQQTETAALETLIREDLELKNLIEKRQRTLRGRISEAENTAKGFSACIRATDAFRGIYAANSPAPGTVAERTAKALKVNSSYSSILTVVPSSNELLATWRDIIRLTDEVSACLERAKLQAEIHLHSCAIEQIAHESAVVAAKQSLQAAGGGLQGLKSSISQKRKKIYSIRCLPTELLQQIFNILVEEKQAFLISRLNTFPSSPKGYSIDPGAMVQTINFVPIILSGTCKRWRNICESTPSLWRFLRIPTTMPPDFDPWVVGLLPFARSIANTNGQNLEITLYPSHKSEIVAQALSAIPSGHSIAKLNVIEGVKIPSALSSALTVVFVGHLGGPQIKTVDLVPQRLQKAQHISCYERLPAIPNGHLLLHSLIIGLTNACVFPDIGRLLTSLPVLRILQLLFRVGVTYQRSTACTNHSLHTIRISSCAFPILQLAIRDGVSIPTFRRFLLRDVDETFAYLNLDNNAATFGFVTHLTIDAVSSSQGSVQIRALLNVMTALVTLNLKGTGVVPGLSALSLEPVMHIPEIALHDSNAICAQLREYIAILGEESRVDKDAPSVRVIWKNCPRFSDYYGAASGALTSKATK
jgi:F-box-like